MLVLQVGKRLQIGEQCSCAHRQVDEQPNKRSRKNDDKSAVAILKKNDLHESVWQPVVNHDQSHERSGDPISVVTPVMSGHDHLLDVFQDMKPP